MDERGLNFVLSVVKGIEPRDQVEAMLAMQMAVIHNATMTFGRRLNHVETVQQQDSAERALNKLARTFTMQMEGLKRYRTSGQQKVTVEHVTVNQIFTKEALEERRFLRQLLRQARMALR